jgi:hypothetical protein
MTLHVPFEAFPEAVKRILRHREAYVSEEGDHVVVTASLPAERVVVACVAEGFTLEAAKEHLRAGGMDVREGVWHLADSPQRGAGRKAPHVAAVSYASGEGKPGVWVDAFETPPTKVQVLRAMFEEFRNTGELPEVSFEEFVRIAVPTVTLVTPTELARYVADKRKKSESPRAAPAEEGEPPSEGPDAPRETSGPASDQELLPNRGNEQDDPSP